MWRLKPTPPSPKVAAVSALGIAMSLLCLTGCATSLPCPGGTHPAQRVDLFFGLSAANHEPVSAEAWQRFSATVLTPTFAAGFTVFEATGQWRNPADNRIVQEPSKVVTVVLPAAGAAGAVRAVTERYRAEFHQTSVGTTFTATCAAF